MSDPSKLIAEANAISNGSPNVKRFALDAAANLVDLAARVAALEAAPPPPPPPPPPPAPSGTLLHLLDYSTGDWTQWGRPGYPAGYDDQIVAGGTVAVQQQTVRAPGEWAARFSTPPYDGAHRSRCQIYLNAGPEYGNDGQQETYSGSFRVDGAIAGGAWNNLISWHHCDPRNELPAPLHIALNGDWTLRIDAWGGPWTSVHSGVKYGDLSHADGWNQYRQTWTIGKLAPGVWCDWDVEVGWSADPAKGHLAAKINGVQVLPRVAAATLYLGDSIYLKQGYDGGGVNAATSAFHARTRIVR